MKWCTVQPQTLLVTIDECLNHAANGPVFVFTKKHAGISLLSFSTPTAESSLHIYTMLDSLGKHTILMELTDENISHLSFE